MFPVVLLRHYDPYVKLCTACSSGSPNHILISCTQLLPWFLQQSDIYNSIRYVWIRVCVSLKAYGHCVTRCMLGWDFDHFHVNSYTHKLYHNTEHLLDIRNSNVTCIVFPVKQNISQIRYQHGLDLSSHRRWPGILELLHPFS